VWEVRCPAKSSGHLWQWMQFGEVDLLATPLPISDPDVTIGPIRTHEERALLVAKRDPWSTPSPV
jgi:hypothetical protein